MVSRDTYSAKTKRAAQIKRGPSAAVMGPADAANLLLGMMASVTLKDAPTAVRLAREGRPFNKGTIYKLLNSRVYLGQAVHKSKAYPGEYKAIIDHAL